LSEREEFGVENRVNAVKLERSQFTISAAKNQARCIGNEARRKPLSAAPEKIKDEEEQDGEGQEGDEEVNNEEVNNGGEQVDEEKDEFNEEEDQGDEEGDQVYEEDDDQDELELEMMKMIKSLIKKKTTKSLIKK
jgi:hypothetical protein